MQRNFKVLFVVGLVMLALSSFVWGVNGRVHAARHDVASTAYVVRAAVLDALAVGGFMCLASAIIALVQLRRATGRLAQTKAALFAIPGLLFAAACVAKLLVAVPFLLAAYDTAPGFQAVRMTVRAFYKLTGIAQLIGLAVCIFFAWHHVAFVLRNRRALKPTLEKCG